MELSSIPVYLFTGFIMSTVCFIIVNQKFFLSFDKSDEDDNNSNLQRMIPNCSWIFLLLFGYMISLIIIALNYVLNDGQASFLGFLIAFIGFIAFTFIFEKNISSFLHILRYFSIPIVLPYILIKNIVKRIIELAKS